AASQVNKARKAVASFPLQKQVLSINLPNSLKHLLIFKGTRYVLVGNIARSGNHPPNVAAVYQITDRLFALSLGYEKLIRFGETLLMITQLGDHNLRA
nr:pleckstrin (PH) domain superfamily protein [Tanacetum cinerariifolium]